MSGSLLKFENKKLIYWTNFQNLDLATGVDTPIKGQPRTWTLSGSGISKSTRTINGVEYPVLFLDGPSSLTLNDDIFNELPNVCTVEVTTYRDAWGGWYDWGGVYFGAWGVPAYNCFYDISWNRGIVIVSLVPMNIDNITYYNQFYHVQDELFMTEDIVHTNVSQIITGGSVLYKNDNIGKCYLAGKKGMVVTGLDLQNATISRKISSDQAANDFCVLDFRIYNYDRFEKME